MIIMIVGDFIMTLYKKVMIVYNSFFKHKTVRIADNSC